jgi:tetratricopeptide (TPR) repeat protein
VKYSEEAFEGARESQDIDRIAPLAWSLCASYFGRGQYDRIVNIAQGVLDLFEKTEREFDFFAMSVNPYSHLCGYCGMSMGYLGNFEGGKIFLEKGLRHAAQIGDLRTLGNIEYFWGMFFHNKGEWKTAMEHLQISIKYSEEVKYLAPLAWGWAFLGNISSFLGDPDTGRRYVEKGLKIQRDAGFEWFLSFYPYFLGDICLHQGDLKNAWSFMDEALRLSKKNSEKWMEGFSMMGLGRILARTKTPQIHKAEKYMLQGIKILDELKLKPSYARSYLALGALYANGGQKEIALENLKKAESMFQEMGMDYWLAMTGKVLAQL